MLVTVAGHEVLTHDVPKAPEELERLCGESPADSRRDLATSGAVRT